MHTIQMGPAFQCMSGTCEGGAKTFARAAPALVYYDHCLYGTQAECQPKCLTRRRDVRLGSKTTGFAYASAALRPSSKEYHSISSPNPRPPLSIGRGTAGNSVRARREAIRFTTATPGVHVTGIRLRKHREAPSALRTAFHFPPRGCRYIWRGLRLCRVCHCKAEKEDRRPTCRLRPHQAGLCNKS